MQYGKNDDFFSLVINSVIDQIRIAPRHQLPHAFKRLLPSHLWKQHKVLK